MDDQWQAYLEEVSQKPCTITFCRHMDETSKLWNYTRHSHPCLEIICFLDGRLTISGQENQMEAGACSVVLHPPHVEHQEFPPAGEHREVLVFWVEHGDMSHMPVKSLVTLDRTGVVRSLFWNIFRENKEKKCYGERLKNLYLSALLLLLARTDWAEGPSEILNLVTGYLQNNYPSKITVEHLTALSSVSASYLDRLFRQHLHSSPMRYLRSIRIRAACRLLAQTDFSVEMIASQVGIPDTSYFWRVFRKEMGISPAGYRKSRKNFPED